MGTKENKKRTSDGRENRRITDASINNIPHAPNQSVLVSLFLTFRRVLMASSVSTTPALPKSMDDTVCHRGAEFGKKIIRRIDATKRITPPLNKKSNSENFIGIAMFLPPMYYSFIYSIY